MTWTADCDAPVFAGPADIGTYGPYGPGRVAESTQGWQRPRYPFQGRITADGSSGHRAEPGRYHIWAAWSCGWAQRVAIVRKLKGLEGVVSLSYVDDERDGRGWAFRERRGPDPVAGFRLLSEAYEATAPGYPGHISTPVLWDRRTGRIVSNHFDLITTDLCTAFDAWAAPGVDLRPEPLRSEIDELNTYLYENVCDGVYRVDGAATQGAYEASRQQVCQALETLDARLADRRYLLGDVVREPDVRLWPTLARFDLAYNPVAGVCRGGLRAFPHLWAYARDLYRLPAFRDTTDFDAYRMSPPPERADGVRHIDVDPAVPGWL
ncbi:glutathione S-transferase C-terminal domain-containing protein [Streptomyces sp. NPDC058657]|uniref:glutathione S-transferase C-terminal domain-containing protein n=1 Tax=unclassified Streptomyces TaxID=2593676 RepID=UPI00365A9466